MSELDLLCECITTEGEAEGGGVKFIYMDEGTIYRFENNRMKKIGKQLINKAKKEITKRSKIPQQTMEQMDETTEKTQRKKRAKKERIEQAPREIEESEEEEDNCEFESLPPKPVKKQKTQSLKRQRAQSDLLSPSIDLDEYYSNKHKMEYMTTEINRLNSKIGKLKQYKSIVNKLTGGEIDELPQQQQMPMPKNNETGARQGVNDSLFMF